MQKNNYSIHACGNGKVLTYHHNADLIQFFGPVYSSPSVGTIKVTDNRGNDLKDVQLEREPYTCIYSYRLNDCTLEDFCFFDEPVFVRDVKGTDINHSITLHDYIKVKDVSFKYGKSNTKVFELMLEAGTYIFFSYPLDQPLYSNLVFTGVEEDNVYLEGNSILFKGEGRLAFVAGGTYPDTVTGTEKYLECCIEKEKEKARQKSKEYFSTLPDFDSILPDVPMRDELLKAIEANIINIKTQQDEEGGVIAGYPYHLGYVRDQFGVAKGMLKLGMKEEALKVLYYFLNEYKREGRINNAHGLGVKGVKHVHENDDVEITGYIVLMFFDYYATIDDDAKKTELFKEFLPLLKWALETQINQIEKGMLPFNGDETYIAGGILPRNAIYDGSSEATILFIDGALKFIEEIKKSGLGFDTRYISKRVEECMGLFNENFVPEGKLITNNPNRLEDDEKPRFRHGVCEGYCGFFGWTERSKEALYICTDCLDKEYKGEKEFKNDKKVYNLKSVLLLPMFINSSFVSIQDIMDEIYEASQEYLKTGRVPSSSTSDRNLGYDFGFLLNSLNIILKSISKDDERFNVFLEACIRLYKDTLNLVDRTYTWCEYYNDNKCAGTQYRPWESAINIRALIEFAENYESLKEYF